MFCLCAFVSEAVVGTAAVKLNLSSSPRRIEERSCSPWPLLLRSDWPNGATSLPWLISMQAVHGSSQIASPLARSLCPCPRRLLTPPGQYMDRSSLFQLIQEQLDPDNTGFIAVENFTSLVEHHELQLDPSKLDMLFALVQSNEDGQVCYQELIELMSSKRSSSFRRAIANGRRTLQREILLDETGLGVYKRFVRYVAYEILPCETDRRWYFHQNRLCPPPVFMAIITIVQIIVFMCYGIMLNKWVLQTYQPDFMKSPLVYHPRHRHQVWRFFSYMFMHVGLEQLGFNALLQLMIGVPLEMVHGILRISLLYMAGVVAERIAQSPQWI
ncbi:hypothetical protein UPYG_G00140160 [Umbra pygmaea]|uniref:rhomboid protease n=1 Tax=Umbra pygmaea TaxID=75934 RepID=A0ABD0WV46_UMBPY